MIRWIWTFMLLVLTVHTARGQGGWYDSVPVSESQTIRQGNATWDESHQWWKLELEEDEQGADGEYTAYIFAHVSNMRKGGKYHFRYKLRGEAPGSFDAGKLRIVTDENMSQGNLYSYFSVQSYPRPNQWMEVSFTATDESFWMMLGAVKKSATTSTTVYIDSISLYELAEPKNACSCNYSNSRYRYGFNGQERDDEIYGRGNSTTAEFWQYDSRLGRRWDNDPVDQISTSNYAVNRNNPIYYNDPNGDCPNCVSAAVGAGIGTLIGGGIEIGMQLHKEGKVSNWKTVRGSALQGGITGGAAGFTGGASLFTTATVAGGGNVVGGILNNKIQGKPLTVVSTATEFLVGAAFGSLGYGVKTLYTKTLANKVNAIFAKAPKNESLSDVAAREWYLAQEAKIPSLLDKTISLESQAKQASGLRNAFRTKARDLMADTEKAAELTKNEVNMTWDQVVGKYSEGGKYTGDALWGRIIDASSRSRTSVNKALGVQPKKE